MDVGAREVGKVGDQFVDSRSGGERVEHVDHPHPGARHDRPSAADLGIDDDAFAHGAKMLDGSGSVNPDFVLPPRPAVAPPLQLRRGAMRQGFVSSPPEGGEDVTPAKSPARSNTARQYRN